MCNTCGLGSKDCPGHFGHMLLAFPTPNICHLINIVNILNCVCIKCSKLLIDKSHNIKEDMEYIIKTSSNNKERFIKLKNLLKKVKYCNKDNYGCGAFRPKIRREDRPQLDIIADYSNISINDNTTDNPYLKLKEVLTADNIYNILKNISEEDCNILGLNYKLSPPENLIIKTLIVSPPAIRPYVYNHETAQTADDDKTHKYADIIKINSRSIKHIETNQPLNPMSELSKSLRLVLQYHIATLFDNDLIGTPSAIQRNGKPIRSITSSMRHKDGRIRGHLMGKRVNFSARTVITPDPNIGIDELGIPLRIASNLTFPETVTEYNIDKLSTYVKNGRTYPGANFIILKSNIHTTKPKKIDLRYNKTYVNKIRIGDIVERHLIDGDIILFNRQPSLHKYSMMGHKVKVILNPDHLTFRMNVNVTTPYNADFDGDEMNLHVPQSIQTATELEHLTWIPLQIISNAKGSPNIGMVMDTLLGAWLMTNHDVTLSRIDFMNLLVHANIDKTSIKLTKDEYKAIELFSYIIPNDLHMRIKGNEVQSEFVIKNGKIIKGIFGKFNIGQQNNSIIHVLWNDYGPFVCTNFINNLQNIVNAWILYYNGFSVSLGDVIINKDTSDDIDKLIDDAKHDVNKSIMEVENGVNNIDYDTLEYKLLQDLTAVRDKAGKMVITNIKNNSTSNRMLNMIESGSKGNKNNIAQISGCLGQQELSGTKYNRIGKLYNGRTLPHYNVDDDSPEARGFISNSYLKGLNPQEFFFHMMAGRIGLIDTAVKTSDTGYIQRKLIKALEDVMIKYDNTVRNANDEIIQFMYGDYGYDVTYFEYQKLGILIMNDEQIKDTIIISTNDILKLNKIKNNSDDSIYNITNISTYSEKDNILYYKNLIKSRDEIRENYLNYNFNETVLDNSYKLPFNLDRIILNNNKTEKSNNLHPGYIEKVLDKLFTDNSIISICFSGKLSNLTKEMEYYSKLIIKTYIYSKLSPKNCIYNLNLSKSEFNNIILKLKKSLTRFIQPGDMIGIIAAQSIGEPSTQITLNTFHSAGISAQGTGSLGLPRLRELMSVSKNMSTPFTYIKLLDDYKYNKQYVDTIQLHTNHLILKDIYDSINIYYDPDFTYMDKDNVDDIYYPITSQNKKCTDNIDDMPWLIKFELNRESLLNKNITLFQIRMLFCKFLNNPILSKNDNKLLDIISSCAILSNYDNSPVPLIHIRLNLMSIDITKIINLKDLFINQIKFRGIAGITESTINHSLSIDFNNINNQEKEYSITTSGINLFKIFQIKGVDVNKTYCNDIHIIQKTYGLEAARTVLLKEFRTIGTGGEFKSINNAHISILVDFMCTTGKIISIDRYGLNKLNTGPLARASFEETTDQFINASLFGEVDNMKSVSSNIMTGQVIKGGTGLCDIMFDIDAIETNNLQEPDFDTNEIINLTQDITIDNILSNDNKIDTFTPFNSMNK